VVQVIQLQIWHHYSSVQCVFHWRREWIHRSLLQMAATLLLISRNAMQPLQQGDIDGNSGRKTRFKELLGDSISRTVLRDHVADLPKLPSIPHIVSVLITLPREPHLDVSDWLVLMVLMKTSLTIRASRGTWAHQIDCHLAARVRQHSDRLKNTLVSSWQHFAIQNSYPNSFKSDEI